MVMMIVTYMDDEDNDDGDEDDDDGGEDHGVRVIVCKSCAQVYKCFIYFS